MITLKQLNSDLCQMMMMMMMITVVVKIIQKALHYYQAVDIANDITTEPS